MPTMVTKIIPVPFEEFNFPVEFKFNTSKPTVQKMLVAVTDFGGVILDTDDETIREEIDAIGNDGRFLGQYHIDDRSLPQKAGIYVWEGTVRQRLISQDGDVETIWNGKFRPATNEDLIELEFNPIESNVLRISSKLKDSIGDLI